MAALVAGEINPAGSLFSHRPVSIVYTKNFMAEWPTRCQPPGSLAVRCPSACRMEPEIIFPLYLCLLTLTKITGGFHPIMDENRTIRLKDIRDWRTHTYRLAPGDTLSTPEEAVRLCRRTRVCLFLADQRIRVPEPVDGGRREPAGRGCPRRSRACHLGLERPAARPA